MRKFGVFWAKLLQIFAKVGHFSAKIYTIFAKKVIQSGKGTEAQSGGGGSGIVAKVRGKDGQSGGKREEF